MVFYGRTFSVRLLGAQSFEIDEWMVQFDLGNNTRVTRISNFFNSRNVKGNGQQVLLLVCEKISPKLTVLPIIYLAK